MTGPGQLALAGPPIWTFLIEGAPRTKKNHGTIWRPFGGSSQQRRRVRVMPSAAWRTWAETAVIRVGANEARWVRQLATGAIGASVNCRALFYREANRGDAVGYYQGLADLLEHRGILVNDRQIVSWDGSRLLKDADRPRVEVALTAVG